MLVIHKTYDFFFLVKLEGIIFLSISCLIFGVTIVLFFHIVVA